MISTWLSALAIVISGLALVVSAVTLWITHLRRGTVEMATPSQIYFGPDGSRDGPADGPFKIYVRAFLYATSKRGRIIENLWLVAEQEGKAQTFNIWVHGDTVLSRGAGVFVSDTGVITGHHFLLPDDDSFELKPKSVEISIFGKIVGDSRPKTLLKQEFQFTEAQVHAVHRGNAGLYFDWIPGRLGYLARIHDPIGKWIASHQSGFE